MKYNIFLPLIFTLTLACNPQEPQNIQNQKNDVPCRNDLEKEGKIYTEGGKTYLYGGASGDFDISRWSLKACQLLDHGLNRESIPALLSPVYAAFDEVDGKYRETDQVIYLRYSGGIKAFPYAELTYYEVINEEVDGHPVMVAYCYLAQLAAVYTRIYCEQELTFALTGYTYAEKGTWEGLDGFLLWDRETESIWWPLVDRAVSGPLLHTALEKHDEDSWDVISWAELREMAAREKVLVIKSGQNQDAPSNWPRIPCAELDCCVE